MPVKGCGKARANIRSTSTKPTASSGKPETSAARTKSAMVVNHVPVVERMLAKKYFAKVG